MEAGAPFHQDPEHMTRSPRAGAVRDAGDYGSGWIAIVTGGLQAIAGLMVLARRFAGQWLAGVLAVVGIFVSFFSLGAYPIWSVIALATNGLVLWAVTAHGDEFDD